MIFDRHSKLRFVLGILRHPSEARLRLREMLRISRAPAVEATIVARGSPDVRLVRVTGARKLKETAVEIYRRNPSPFVAGPKSVDQIEKQMDAGLRFYLVLNDAGQTVGVRGFDANTGTLQNTITEFEHRGAGYQVQAGKLLREQLASEGFTEFRSTVLRTNTRIRRALEAAGWEMTDDPDNPDLIRAVLRL